MAIYAVQLEAKMKTVLLFSQILALTQHVWSLACPTTPAYNAVLTLECSGADVKILWPDYANVSRFFSCEGKGNPISEDCLPNTVFDFGKQMCVTCEDYVPAPPCQGLKGRTSCKLLNPKRAAVPTEEHVAACKDLAAFDTTFVPKCVGADIYMHWPNDKNTSEYYWCQSAYNPRIKACPENTLFNYYAQTCTGCDSYVVAPDCQKLPFDKSNKCHKF